MGKHRPYTLTAPKLKRIKNSQGVENIGCYRCGRQLCPGDNIVSTKNVHSSGVKRKYYHAKCWESLFIEVPA